MPSFCPMSEHLIRCTPKTIAGIVMLHCISCRLGAPCATWRTPKTSPSIRIMIHAAH